MNSAPLNKKVAIPLSFLLVLGAWYTASLALTGKNTGNLVLLPMPHVVVKDLVDLLVADAFWKDILASMMRILSGVSLAMFPAFILGFWFGLNPRVYSVGEPLFSFAKYIPPVSFVPILILWLGIGLIQQLALLFIGIFFFLTMMTAETVANTPKALINAGRTLGLGRFSLIFKVVFPFVLPRLFEHLRTMLGIAWTYLVVVEMVAAPNGIGRVIINSQRFLNTGRVLAGMLTIGLLGIVFNWTLLGLSRIVCRWEGYNDKH